MRARGATSWERKECGTCHRARLSRSILRFPPTVRHPVASPESRSPRGRTQYPRPGHGVLGLLPRPSLTRTKGLSHHTRLTVEFSGQTVNVTGSAGRLPATRPPAFSSTPSLPRSPTACCRPGPVGRQYYSPAHLGTQLLHAHPRSVTAAFLHHLAFELAEGQGRRQVSAASAKPPAQLSTQAPRQTPPRAPTRTRGINAPTAARKQ